MRKSLMKRIVKNYYAQCEIVKSQGRTVKITLLEYIEGIKKHSQTMTQEEVEYGMTMEVNNESPIEVN